MINLPIVSAREGMRLIPDVLVVDLTTSIAGPYATMLLGDFGATVIKIERMGTGDDARAWGPPFLDGEALIYLAVNRNKKSVALDIAAPEGRAVFEDLVRRADVVVSNQPARVQRKLAIDYERLQALKDDLIFASITGFGLEGERAGLNGYDLIAEGYSGIMDLTGEASGPPQKIGTPAADMLAGQDAAMSILAALLDRGRTGRGKLIDIALVDSMTRFLACRIVPYLGGSAVPRRSGAKDSVVAIYQAFDTADEPITLGIGTDAIWRRFWEAVGQPGKAERGEMASNAGRLAHRAAIVAEIQALLTTQPRAHWLDLFATARVPAGPINRVDEVVQDEALIARGLFYSLADGDRTVPQVGLGIQLDGEIVTPRYAPPKLGADTDDVLDNLLSYGADRVAALRAAGVI